MVEFVKRHWIWLLLLTFLVLASYGNSLTNEFVSDDIGSIPGNPALQSINYIFNNPTFFARTIPYYFAFKIGGTNPLFFRLINIIFHIGNVWLVYIIFLFLTNKRVALLTAAIFAVHPLLIESVAWISGGVYSQYTFFLLLSFFLYIKFSQNRFIYLLSLFAFLFALSTSEKAAVLPLIIVAYEFSVGDLKKHWKKIVPYFLMVVAWVIILFSLRLSERVEFLESQFHLQKGFDNPIYQIPIAIVSYLKLIFFPLTLSFYHSELRFSFLQYFVYLFFFLIYLAGLGISYAKNRLIFFWLMFFFLSLLPTLTPFRISWVVAERYVYLGSIGIIFVFSYFLTKLATKEAYKQVIIIVSICLVLLLSIRTIRRNMDWKNHDTLWPATLKTSPSSPVTHNNMADVYSRQGDIKNAERELLTAIHLNPNYADAYHNLANIYKDTKKT
ncbi:tetratricopeptide repeat protein, partial [Candidatus Roizmanbacteria bacterium]|nr:tetratricopeptide repeat protein [Candidatus Roizmanbacteria bacterium]